MLTQVAEEKNNILSLVFLLVKFLFLDISFCCISFCSQSCVLEWNYNILNLGVSRIIGLLIRKSSFLGRYTLLGVKNADPNTELFLSPDVSSVSPTVATVIAPGRSIQSKLNQSMSSLGVWQDGICQEDISTVTARLTLYIFLEFPKT